jgi:hypothetical protein
MTEESEHYMDPPKVHKSPTTSLDPEPDTQDKHTTSPGPPRANLATYFTEVEYVARFLLHQGHDDSFAGGSCRTARNLRHARLQLLERRHELALRH